MKLGIYCPTWHRPHKLQEVATNIEQTTRTPFNLVWGCEPDDIASIEAAKATGHKVVINKGNQGYSDTMQAIYEQGRESIFFHANDDFYFLDGWDEPYIKFLKERPEIMVVGAHDGLTTPSFWTICFIRRKYIKEQSGVIDMPNRVFYPYNHNYVDTEFTKTAISRGVWDKVDAPCIEHRRAEHDETYAKNAATFQTDSETFHKRERTLW